MTPVHVKGYTPWPEAFVQRYREKKYWRDQPLDHFLKAHAETTPNKIALVDERRELSYGALYHQVNQLALSLLRLGLGAGDTAVVQLGNSTEFFIVFFALVRIGVVPVMALPAHRYTEIKYFCECARASVYFFPENVGNYSYASLANRLFDEGVVSRIIDCSARLNVEPLREGNHSKESPGKENPKKENPSKKNSEHTNNSATRNGIKNCATRKFVFLQDLLHEEAMHTNNSNTVPLLPEIDARGLALLQLSGGTTNLPKLIPRTHNDYLYSIRASAKICGLTPHTVYLAVLPVAHNFTLTSPGALGALVTGGTVVLNNNGAPDTAFKLIEKYRVSIAALVPPLAIVWLEYAKKTNRNISSLSVLQVGGAKLSSALAEQIRPALGCQLQQVFGMAEGLVNYTRLDDCSELINHTQGRPICVDDEIKIVDSDDNEVTPGEPGLLLTRGPYTIRGYFNAQGHNLKAFTHDGFYRTGDIVQENSQGYLTVVGRYKDQINRGGEKVSAEEIENYLLSHPHIHDAAAVAMPDAFLGEKICVYVVKACLNTRALRLPVVRAYLRNLEVADYKLPDRIEVIDTLPKTKFGKVNKKELREIIAGKIARAAHNVNSNTHGESNGYT